uniref:Uncharacterized protein n=1 Tax=Ciona intestinalis TaxID=7719 RepID=H2XMF6_CIOIN
MTQQFSALSNKLGTALLLSSYQQGSIQTC